MDKEKTCDNCYHVDICYSENGDNNPKCKTEDMEEWLDMEIEGDAQNVRENLQKL